MLNNPSNYGTSQMEARGIEARANRDSNARHAQDAQSQAHRPALNALCRALRAQDAPSKGRTRHSVREAFRARGEVAVVASWGAESATPGLVVRGWRIERLAGRVPRACLILRRLLVPLLLPFAAVACDLTGPDPCPMPPDQHPEAWRVVPLHDEAGNVVTYAYVCAPG